MCKLQITVLWYNVHGSYFHYHARTHSIEIMSTDLTWRHDIKDKEGRLTHS